MAASLLLHYEMERVPSARPLSRFAIFLASPLPFGRTVDIGIDTREYFGVPGRAHPQGPRLGCPARIPSYLVTDKAYLRSEVELEGKAVDSLGGTLYQVFHATVDEVRIRLPTAHVYGRKDPWKPHNVDLMALCDQETMFQLEHSWGHEIRRGATEEMCDLIETTVLKAGCVSAAAAKRPMSRGLMSMVGLSGRRARPEDVHGRGHVEEDCNRPAQGSLEGGHVVEVADGHIHPKICQLFACGCVW